MPLNAEVLEQSFERIRPFAAEFSASFYSNLLTDYPELRPLFANTNMQEQESKLMISLVLVINNVRHLAYLSTMLKELGARHVRYATLAEHYPMVGAALLKTFKFYLGEEWTPEVEKAWTDAYGEIVNLMLEGANDYEKELKLKNATQPYAKPTVTSEVPTQAPATASSLDYPTRISRLEDVSKSNVNPSMMGKAPPQANATTSGLNLKLLLIVLVVVSLLGVGFLYYQSRSQQDNTTGYRSPLETKSW